MGFFSSTLKQSLGSSQAPQSLCLLWLRKLLWITGQWHSRQYNRVFLFIVQYRVLPLSGLGNHPKYWREYLGCTCFPSGRWPQCQLQPEVRGWDCVVKTSWCGVTTVTQAEWKRHRQGGGGGGAGSEWWKHYSLNHVLKGPNKVFRKLVKELFFTGSHLDT